MNVPNPKSMDARILEWSLRVGAVYFVCVALAHTAGFKVPGLLIYFNVPSYPYQDQLIGILAIGWAALFYVASTDPVGQPVPVRALLFAGAMTILGLGRINACTNFGHFSPDITTEMFWAQLAILVCYLVWLIVIFHRARRGTQ